MLHISNRRLAAIVAVTALLAAGPVYLATAPATHAETATTPATTLAPMPTLAPLVETVTPAVVNIAVESKAPAEENPMMKDPFFRKFFNMPNQMPARPQMSAGSGVIVDAAQGYVLTNFHVVDHADDVTVTLKDRRKFKAKVVGSDPGTDIALLKIDADHLTALPFGDSDSLHVGDYVVAIGNPFALGQTVTAGIVSALGRSGLNIEGYEDFIQTDASINPGNSGGALVNLKGELVGINTAIVGPAGGNVGIGFAVPTSMAHLVMDQLAKYGTVHRGRLGIMVQDLTPNVAQAMKVGTNEGAIVSQVEPGSPADKAGIKAGDVVTELDKRPVHGASDLRNHIGLMSIGQDVEIGLVRDGAQKTVEAKVAKAPEKQEVAGETGASGETVAQLEGAQFRNIEPGMPEYGHSDGVLVSQVAEESPAARHGIRDGDVITAVNREKVRSIDDLKTDVGKAKGVITLNILRDGASVFLVIS
jgi:serine protease DegQ